MKFFWQDSVMGVLYFEPAGVQLPDTQAVPTLGVSLLFAARELVGGSTPDDVAAREVLVRLVQRLRNRRPAVRPTSR